MSFVDVVAGTRPNLVKAAAILHAMREKEIEPRFVRFVYTSQHYDDALFREVSSQLEIGPPDVVFDRPKTSSDVLSSVFDQYTELLKNAPRPKLSIVFGDVSSTLAATLAARFGEIPVAHVEAGLRSHNWSMPEEVNRVAVDAISTHAFVTSANAIVNLRNHDNLCGRTFFVGNTMIDTLVRRGLTRSSKNDARRGSSEKPVLIVTLHRPSNVDDGQRLEQVLLLVRELVQDFCVIFPVHLRTANRIRRARVQLPHGVGIAPMPYFDFVSLLARADAVITDSGGVSEETTFLRIPCITLRTETERPETVELGTNILVGENLEVVPDLLRQVLDGRWKSGRIPPLWDGKAGERIVNKLMELDFLQ